MRKSSLVITATITLCIFFSACTRNDKNANSIPVSTDIENVDVTASGVYDEPDTRELDSSEEGVDSEINDLSTAASNFTTMPRFSANDTQGYINYLAGLSDVCFYYTVRFQHENYSAYRDITLDGIKGMYDNLNEDLDFNTFIHQSLSYSGYYDGDLRFIDAGSRVEHVDRMKNQRVFDWDGNEYYHTPIKATFLGRSIYHHYDTSIIKGRNFVEPDFEVNSPDEPINVVLGFSYLDTYDIGDVFQLSLYLQGIDFRVVGFYKEGIGISEGLGVLDSIAFDNNIIVPFFRINYEPIDNKNYSFQIDHYINMTQGNIRITEPIENVNSDTHAMYLAVIEQMAEANGLTGAYYIPLWPVVISLQS